ncbi:MAG: APC family permease [Thermoprotei archaeon]
MNGNNDSTSLFPNLRRGVLGLKEVYGQAMGVTAPLGSVVSTTTAAVVYAGAAVPLATVMAFLGSVLWIWILTRYSNKLASPGGYYSFSSGAYGSKKLSLFEALTEVAAYVFLNAFDAVAAYLLLEVAGSFFGITISPVYAALVMLFTVVYPTLISLTDVKHLMGKIVMVGSTLEVVLLIGFFMYQVARHGFPLTPFEPSAMSSGVGGLATAFILSLVSISGAGTATYLGEETHVPTKTISRGMWLALLLGGLSMILGSYAIVVGWGLSDVSSLTNSAQPLFQEIGGLSVLALVITALLALNSLLVQNIGVTVGAARILFNLARERSAPKVFAGVRNNGQPLAATLFVGLITGILTIASTLWLGIMGAFAVLGVPLSVLWVLGRTIDTIGLPLFLKRIEKVSVGITVVSAIMAALNLWGIFETFYPPSFAASILMGCFAATYIVWYRLWGSKGSAGQLVVDEDCSVVPLAHKIERLRAEKGGTT